MTTQNNFLHHLSSSHKLMTMTTGALGASDTSACDCKAGTKLPSSLLYNHKGDDFLSYPGVCGWSWSGSPAGRKTLGSALWRHSCCLRRPTPTPSSRCKTSALGYQTLPVWRQNTVRPSAQRWTKLCSQHINKVDCLIQCCEPYFIFFIVLCKQEIFAAIWGKLFIFL